MIEADPSESAHSIITQIHEALRFDGRGTLKGMFRDAVERLKDSGRLIIIDEAEHLQYRALEMVRRLHDKTGIGIVLAGMNRLYSNLRGRTAQYAQLYSRVAVYVRLEPATDADVVAVLQTVFPDINGTATQFCRLSRGSMRHLEKLVRRVIRMAEINGCAVDDDLVVAAAQSLIF